MLQWFKEELEELKVDAENFTNAVLKEREAIPIFALQVVCLIQRAFLDNYKTEIFKVYLMKYGGKWITF